MRSTKLSLLVIAGLSICAFCGRSVADESKDYAIKALATWSAFECASIASMSKDAKEQERLFLFGYEQGRQFITALQAGKIKREHLSNQAPWGLLLLLEGPTPDFMLGRIFESAQDNALNDIFKTGEHFNSDEEQLTLAKTKFRQLNCQLIGK